MNLYKYVVPERVDVLVNGMIRFTQPTALNDPFELRPYFDTLVPEEQVWGAIHGQVIDLVPMLREAYDKQSAEIRSQVSLEDLIELMRSVLATPEGRQAAAEGVALVPQTLRAAVPIAQKTIFQGLAQHVGVLSLK